MEHFFVTLFEHHSGTMRHWGILVLFVVAFLESLPILGAFLPGQTLIIFGGFLAKIGFFGFLPALLVTACGAVLGDLTGFFLGKRFGKVLMHRKIWKLERKHFESTVNLVENNSIKSIFIGRIHSFTRSLMPFAAGMSRISTKKFIAVDVITAVIWALLSLVIGYIFGKSFELASAFIGKFFLMATLITIVLIAAVSHVRKQGKKIAPVDAVLFGVSVSFLYLFAITASSYATSRFYVVLDSKMAHFALMFRTEWLTNVMMIFSVLGGPIVMTAISALFVLLLLSRKRFWDASLAIAILGIGVIAVNFLKAVFQRARPAHELVPAFGTSFPSGHAMVAVMFAITLYYVVLRKIRDDRHRGVLIFISWACAFAIGLSRVYLNVHWASDVLAGFAGGIFLSTFIIVIFRLVVSIVKRSRQAHSLPNLP